MPLSKRYVAVGDSAEVGIGLRVGRSKRKLNKSPRITTSDPEKKNISFKLQAQTVESFDSTSPATIHPQIVHIPPDKREAEFMLVIRNVTDEAMEPRIVSQQPGVLDITLPEGAIGPGEESAIHLTVAEEFDKLAHKTSFTMQMSDDEESRYTIPVEIGTAGQITTRSRPVASRAGTKPPATSKSEKQVIRPTGGKQDKSGGK
jgi:hypothetical protein